MPDFLNHCAISAPRNGTTTHTVTPSSGTVAAGTLFTPTAGRFLLCAVEAPVTSTTPTSWTLPAGGSAVNISGLYVWYRASAAGSDSISTTHNVTNYPAIFDFYEFAAGTTFSGSVSATGVALSGGAGPTLTGLTGTNWIAGAAAQANSNVADGAVSWNAGTELVDSDIAFATTDGYLYSLTALDSSAATSQSFAATLTGSSGNTVERLVFAVKPPAAAAATRIRTIGKRR
jgi:hypothetical protein